MASLEFLELLQEAEKLSSNVEGVSELPKVERSLRQVLEASSELYNRVARQGTQDIQANLLLGTQGVDLPRIVKKLEHISTQRTLEPIKPTVDTDVPALLENELRNVIVKSVETEFKGSKIKIFKDAWLHELALWNKERSKIVNSMSVPSRNVMRLSKHSSFFMEPIISTSSSLGSHEAIYATKVVEYNKSVARGSDRINLIKSFASVAEEFKDTKVNDIWDIMKYMTEFPPFASSENAIKTRNSKPIIKVLISQAKKYLENRYKVYMSNVINENLAEAKRGGVPGTYSLVRSFVNVRLHGKYAGLQGGMVDDRPLWPVVYYCLRSGELTAAIHCLKRAAVDTKAILPLLEMKFKNPESPEIIKLETALQVDYKRLTRNSTDPFQRVVYAILCCCDHLDEHSEVAKTADDYLWLKLSYLRINTERDDSKLYRELQATILDEYGESHYNALNQPHLYFQMLALTGQFEAAIEFLARIERYQMHSVHIAIALNELQMLGLSHFPTAPLISFDAVDAKPSRRLNLCRLIMIYIQKFELDAPKEAVEYLFFLRNIYNEQKRRVFVTCIIDLALETRKYELLFGKVQRNGTRSKGYLDNFAINDINVENIAQELGGILANKGLFEDAVELYDIANNQEDVLSLLCTLMSQVVHLQTVEGSLRQRLVPKVNDISQRYLSIGFNCSACAMSSFAILKELLVFFDLYHSKQFNLALQTLHEIQVIPTHINEVKDKINAFNRYNADICKVIPDVILATMNILFSQYQKVKSNEYIPSRYQDATQDTQLAFLREQAKTLTYFAGLLPQIMPGDTNSRLVQMEILMH